MSLFLLLSIVFQSYVGIGLVYPIFSTLFFDPELSFLSSDVSSASRGIWLGVILAITPLMQLIASPYAGTYSDRLGRKNLLLFSIMMATIGYALSIIALDMKSISLLSASRVFVGIGGSSACVAQAALYDRKRDPKIFGLYNMMLGAGLTIGPFIGGKFTDSEFQLQFGFTLPFWILFISLLCILALVWFFYFDKEQVVTKTARIRESWNLFSYKGIRRVLISAFIFSFGWAYFLEFVPVYLINQYSFKGAMIGNFYAFSGAMYAISCGLFIRPLLKFIPLPSLLFLALLFAGSYSLIFLSIENALWIWIYSPLLLFLVAIIYPVLSGLLVKEASQENVGKALGLLQSIQSLAFALSPLLSGVLIGLHAAMPIFMGGGAMLLSALFFGLSSYFEQSRQV